MTAVGVRAATPADAAALGGLHVRGWRAAYRGIMPQDYLDALEPTAREERWRAHLLAPPAGTHVLVAVTDGAPSGFVSAGAALAGVGPGEHRPAEGTGQVYALYVDPDRWRAGIGSALVAAAQDALRSGGRRTAVLWVATANDRARRFYEHHGWSAEPVTTTGEYGGVQVEETRYHRAL